MNSNMKNARPKLVKKKSPEQLAVMDEILQVVRDQGKRMSLSNTDYRIQQQLSVLPAQRRHSNGLSEASKDDSRSWCTTSSDLSYSPPSTPHEGSFPYFPESDSEQDLDSVTSNNGRNLPPLDPRKIRRSTCHVSSLNKHPTKDSYGDSLETPWPVKPKVARPKSARSIRTRPRYADRLTADE